MGFGGLRCNGEFRQSELTTKFFFTHRFDFNTVVVMHEVGQHTRLLYIFWMAISTHLMIAVAQCRTQFNSSGLHWLNVWLADRDADWSVVFIPAIWRFRVRRRNNRLRYRF